MRTKLSLVIKFTMGVACATLFIDHAHATFLTPTGVQSTSEYGTGFGVAFDDNLINSNGLSTNSLAGTHDNNVTADTMWHAGPVNGGLGGPTGNPPAVDDQIVRFDLGANYNLTGSYVWNHNQLNNTGRGVDEFEIWVASTNVGPTFSQIGTTYNLSEAGGGGAEPAQTVGFLASNVRLVEFRINSDHNALANDYVGLSEVRFEGVLVPEPGSLLLGMIGTIGVARNWRRRRFAFPS